MNISQTVCGVYHKFNRGIRSQVFSTVSFIASVVRYKESDSTVGTFFQLLVHKTKVSISSYIKVDHHSLQESCLSKYQAQ